jgi:hypothetical protein
LNSSSISSLMSICLLLIDGLSLSDRVKLFEGLFSEMLDLILSLLFDLSVSKRYNAISLSILICYIEFKFLAS